MLNDYEATIICLFDILNDIEVLTDECCLCGSAVALMILQSCDKSRYKMMYSFPNPNSSPFFIPKQSILTYLKM